MDTNTLFAGLGGALVGTLGPKIIELLISWIKARYGVKEKETDTEAQIEKKKAETEESIRISDRSKLYELVAGLRLDLTQAQDRLKTLQDTNLTLLQQIAVLQHEKDKWEADRIRWEADRIQWASEKAVLEAQVKELQDRVFPHKK